MKKVRLRSGRAVDFVFHIPDTAAIGKNNGGLGNG